MTAGDLPDDFTPAEALAAIDDLDALLERGHLWHASVELDGEAATIRRAIDAALGRHEPTFVEIGPGQVLELGAHNDDDDQEPHR